MTMTIYIVQTLLLTASGVLLIRKRYPYLFYFTVMPGLAISTTDVFIEGDLTNFRLVAATVLAFFLFMFSLKTRRNI